jgi:serine protease Do
MNTRTRTIASFFSVAMAAMLLGAVVTTQMRPQAAMARSPEPAAAATAIPGRTLGPPTLETFRDIAHGATPGVVNINTKKLLKGQRGGSFRDFFGDDMFDRFFGPQGPDGQGPRGPQGRGGDAETQRSLGSGFVVDRDGYILTNRHVIDGADQISVTLSNGKTYEAKLVGKDARTDVALIKIEPKETLTTLALGNSDQTDVAEWVMAIGNPFGLWQDGAAGGPSVTVGVVSYKGRSLGLGVRGTTVEMIQTDASINPGNSGGPLLNTKGEVIGINTMIITNGPQQSSGVGFAVPINVAKEILPQLRTKGRVTRGWLGVQIQPVTEPLARSYKLKEAKGALIADVTDGSPADKAGLKPDDVVIGVDGREVRDNSDLTSYIASRAPDTTVHLKVLRGGAEKDVAVTLGTFPEETSARDESSDREGRSHQGMSLQDLTPDMAAELQLPRGFKGVIVSRVEAGSNAEDAGLQRGDVIVSVNGESADRVQDVENALAKAKPDGVARIRFRRGNQYTFTTLRLD